MKEIEVRLCTLQRDALQITKENKTASLAIVARISSHEKNNVLHYFIQVPPACDIIHTNTVDTVDIVYTLYNCINYTV